MKAYFRIEDEPALFGRFAASSTIPKKERSQLKRFADVFHDILPGETPLNHTGHTTWVPAWLTRARMIWVEWSARERLWIFARFAHWLFHQNLIDDDAFAHVEVTRCLRGEELTLRYNLHRLIERFIVDMEDVGAGRRRDSRVVLLTFNTLLNRHLPDPIPAPGELTIDRDIIFRWVRERGQRVSVSTLYDELGLLHRCLELGIHEGVIAQNSLRTLLQRYGARGFRGLVEAALASETQVVLETLRVEPRFDSLLAGSIKGLLASMRALGYRMHSPEGLLAHLDRFLRGLPPDEQHLSAETIERWLATTPAAGPGQRRTRWLWARRLCQYLHEEDQSVFVPDLPEPQRYPRPRPPFLYSPEQVRILLNSALELAPAGSLRPRTYHAVIALLYGAGLRVSEALNLNLDDFDTGQALLLVRETKFYKSRWIPLAPSVATCLEDYITVRTVGTDQIVGDAPVFINLHGRRCTYGTVYSTFLALLRRTGLRGPVGTPGPRMHDLRHSFAVHRLTRWYEEGEDVQAKLPLLSTYLGHSSIVATEVYLTVTADLLRQGAQRFYDWRGSSTSAQEKEMFHDN